MEPSSASSRCEDLEVPFELEEMEATTENGQGALLLSDDETVRQARLIMTGPPDAAQRCALRGLGGSVLVGALVAMCVFGLRRALPATALRTGQDKQDSMESAVIHMDAPSWSGFGRCGVATNILDNNDRAMTAFCGMDVDFWWNWGPAPVGASTTGCAWPKFVPMIWGSSAADKDLAREAGTRFPTLMGYNEPDLWGPPPHPGEQYLSSGTFLPTFHCGSPELAAEWQQVVTQFRNSRPGGTVVSPAMADPSGSASTYPDWSACEASPQTWENHMPWCLGWMKCFKENVIKLDCGGVNCWDAIGVLQFHAYAYTSAGVIGKVKGWESMWNEDLSGINGRSKKTIWLTEFSHLGTTDPNDPGGEARGFMEETIAYLQASPFVSGWSWFSQTYASFKTGREEPNAPYWNSELITKEGGITALGQKYQEICSRIAPGP